MTWNATLLEQLRQHGITADLQTTLGRGGEPAFFTLEVGGSFELAQVQETHEGLFSVYVDPYTFASIPGPLLHAFIASLYRGDFERSVRGRFMRQLFIKVDLPDGSTISADRPFVGDLEAWEELGRYSTQAE